MQDVNNDMDELLRRAANSYPLNTGSADWNKVSEALRVTENVQPDNYIDRVRKYLRLLMLVMLISIPVVCVDYVFMNNHLSNVNVLEMNSKAAPGKTLAGAAKEDLKKVDKNVTLIARDKNRNNDFIAKNDKQLSSKLIPIHLGLSGFASNKKLISDNTYPEKNNELQKNQDLALLIKRTDERERDGDNSITEKTGIAPTTEAGKSSNSKNTTDTSLVNEKVIQKEAVVIKPTNKHEFYAGLLAGPDISTIKFQTVNNTGFSAGLVIGYTLNKKLSIETGVLWDKKFYYTDGKYFNPKNLSIPSYIHIDDLQGSCSMIELPVNLSYKIKSYKKSFLTVNAGISSYFMKRENYSYTYQRNGVEREWALSYKNSSNNLFSVVNIGAGYNRNLSKSILLRIEPYVKIPISGIGSGRLPITSSGLYIVLTRKIR